MRQTTEGLLHLPFFTMEKKKLQGFRVAKFQGLQVFPARQKA